MKRTTLAVEIALLVATIFQAQVFARGILDLAGKYRETRTLQMLDETGTKYTAENVLEIRPIAGTRARLFIRTDVPNGHSCFLEGYAAYRAGVLVHRGSMIEPVSGRRCELRIWRDGTRLRYADGGSCASFCGARGTLTGSFPYPSRRRWIAGARDYDSARQLLVGQDRAHVAGLGCWLD